MFSAPRRKPRGCFLFLFFGFVVADDNIEVRDAGFVELAGNGFFGVPAHAAVAPCGAEGRVFRAHRAAACRRQRGCEARPAQQNRGGSGVVAQLVAGDGHQHGAEAEFERILVARAVGASAGVAAPRHARVVADDAEVFGQGSERRARRRAVGLARRRVGVGFERRVGLLRQVVEV